MQANTQPIEKLCVSDGMSLDVQSIFYTIQGEGPYTGHPAVFVRLAGCNLQCPGCDTDYTSDRKAMKPIEIASRILDLFPTGRGLVVITGGEPFRQNITPLCRQLIYSLMCSVQVETNGTLPPSHELPEAVKIVCSPKAGKVNAELAKRAAAYKYVLSGTSVASDGLPGLVLGHSASPHVARPPSSYRGIIYLQPMDAQDEEQNLQNQKVAVASCMEHGYVMQLQTHKILNLE